jgi:hypothetical protein
LLLILAVALMLSVCLALSACGGSDPCKHEDKDGDGKIDGTEIALDPTLSSGDLWDGISDSNQRKNLNVTAPPATIAIINNNAGYVYLVPDTYTYADLGENGFFEKTKFIHNPGADGIVGTGDDLYYQGTNHQGEDTVNFKFVPIY